jgi:hypothetical protein
MGVTRDILAHHQPEPLDPSVESWMRERFELRIP